MSKNVHDIVQFFEGFTGEHVTMYDTPGKYLGQFLSQMKETLLKLKPIEPSREVNVLHNESGFETIECGKRLIETHG